MKSFYLLLVAFMPVVAISQLTMTYQIQEDNVLRSISPYIYGSCNGGYQGATVVRIGGSAYGIQLGKQCQ